jgi:hypothetical protein
MSRIVVQKYGGTSVGDVDRIHKVAARIARTVEAGTRWRFARLLRALYARYNCSKSAFIVRI